MTNPGYFDTRLQHDPRRAAAWRHVTRHLERYVPANASVLELGAGYCYFINAVPAQRRVAVDLSPDMLRWKDPAVEGVVANAVEYLRDAESDQFDFILASNFFEHFVWEDLDPMLRSIARILRPGGQLAIIQPNFRLSSKRYFDDYTHRSVFTDVSLPDWLRSAGLTVTHVDPRFMPLTVKSRAAGLSFLIPLYLKLPFRPFAGQMFVLAERARA